MRVDPIYLTNADLTRLRKQEVGHGTDGMVLKYDNKHLIKIYHRKLFDIIQNLDKLDNKIKIYQKGSYKTHNKAINSEPINYYIYDKENDEDIKMQSRQAIKKAIARQKYISRTELPKNMVYVDNIYAGCLLTKVKGIQIHKLTGLPLKYRKIIMHEVITSVKELLDNYIYHLDLDNSPYSNSYLRKNDGTIESVGHSHVLVDLVHKKTNIIDLEGKSTVYMERYNEEYEFECLRGLCILLIEFLLQIDTDEFKMVENEVDALAYALEEARVKKEYIDKLSTYSVSIDDLDNIVKSL